MAERSNAAVLKTVDCYRSGGSNPSLSAQLFKCPFTGHFSLMERGKFTFHGKIKKKGPYGPILNIYIKTGPLDGQFE